ncbi:MAG: hypothetical protein ACRDAX_02845 [Propionibacteriaceae bacterium]
MTENNFGRERPRSLNPGRPSQDSRGSRRDDDRGGFKRDGERSSDRSSERGFSRGPRRDDDRGGFKRDNFKREDEAPKEWRPGLKPREDEPNTPRDVDIKILPRQVRAELRGLPSDLADVVAAHLVAAGMLIDEDPELAYRHAEAARRRASRLPIVREATAETAYAAGDYTRALTEFRALRRMSGSYEYHHVMADCERALGRPEAALVLIKEAARSRPSAEQAVELRLVEAGCREDMGQGAEALRLLKTSIEECIDGSPVAQARLRFAYAEALLRRNKEDHARKWLETAIRLDPEDESGAAERLAELDGIEDFELFIDDEDEDDEEQEVEAGQQ